MLQSSLERSERIYLAPYEDVQRRRLCEKKKKKRYSEIEFSPLRELVSPSSRTRVSWGRSGKISLLFVSSSVDHARSIRTEITGVQCTDDIIDR